MTLQGPRLAGPITTPRSTTLLGVADTLAAHPMILVAGFLAGAWLAHKHISPWGAVWGEHHARHNREKSLSGGRRRKRRR